MNKYFIAQTALLCFMASAGCRTPHRNTVTLAFSPATLSSGSRTEAAWNESGYRITSPSQDRDRPLMGSESVAGSLKPTPQNHFAPVNGTDYLRFTSSTNKDGHMTRDNGMPFTPVSVDIAEYSTVYPKPKPVFFYGTKLDGKVVACSFVTDGVIDGPEGKKDFETFQFPDCFRNIAELSWCIGGFALDNLVIEETYRSSPQGVR